jgi:hypothetical protein
MAYGVIGLLGARRAMPSEVGLFIIGAAVLHDGVVAPITVLLGGVVVRWMVPARWRAAVAATFVMAAPITLFAIPFVRGYGRDAGNPSLLPGNYGRGLAVVIAAIVVGAVITCWPRRRGTEEPDG